MINVSENAVKHLRAMLREKGAEEGQGLRVFVEKGGCAGMQYGMKLDQPAAGDVVVGPDDAKVMIDAESAGYLDGSTIDFTDELAGAGFRIVNPNAVRSCGCGTSFEAPSAAHA